MKRPRFSLRTLAIVVTLICAYFAAWRATKRYGVPTIIADHYETAGEGSWRRVIDAASPVPFIVYQDEERTVQRIDASGIAFSNTTIYRNHYLWMFGPKFKLR